MEDLESKTKKDKRLFKNALIGGLGMFGLGGLAIGYSTDNDTVEGIGYLTLAVYLVFRRY